MGAAACRRAGPHHGSSRVILDVVTGIAAVILVLLVVVLVHEGGHFVLAKWAGVRVDEFAFGFGPRLWAHRRGETTYSLRAIPAGGYVKMAGMLGLEGEADAGERNFYRASIPKRMMVILAGIVANMILAGLLFTVYFATPDGLAPARRRGGAARRDARRRHHRQRRRQADPPRQLGRCLERPPRRHRGQPRAAR